MASGGPPLVLCVPATDSFVRSIAICSCQVGSRRRRGFGALTPPASLRERGERAGPHGTASPHADPAAPLFPRLAPARRPVGGQQ